MSKKKIICMVIILLFMVTTYPLSANMKSSNQQIEPEGRVIFMAHATGPCLIGWGAGTTGDQAPDFYMEQGQGFIMNFGTMLYHSLLTNDGLLPEFGNYIVEDNEAEVVWNVNTKTLISINWQHEEIKHHLQVICTSLEETMCFFTIIRKAYGFGPLRGYYPEEHELNCIEFTGFHKNGSKTESISGYALMLAIRDENLSSPDFPEPLIDTILFKKEGGEYEPLITVVWTMNGWEIGEMNFPKAKLYHVNYWLL